MKKSKTLFILLFLCLGNFLFAQSNLKFAFYNVENLFDTIDSPDTFDTEFTPTGKNNWNTHRYYKKMRRISQVIDSINANNDLAVLGMAEVENRTALNDLINYKTIKKSGFEIVHQDSPDARGIDVACIYNPKLVKLNSYKYYNVKITDSDSSKTRDILYCVFELKNKSTVHYFVNHWPSRRGGEEESSGKRKKAAENLKSICDSIFKIDVSANIIICGDLNDHPDNESVVNTLGAANPNSAEKSKLFSLMWTLKNENKGTHFYKGEWSILDHFIVSQSILQGNQKIKATPEELNVFEASFLFDTNKKGEQVVYRTFVGPRYTGGYSDHLPIILNMTIKN